jgi:hypothetical protein
MRYGDRLFKRIEGSLRIPCSFFYDMRCTLLEHFLVVKVSRLAAVNLVHLASSPGIDELVMRPTAGANAGHLALTLPYSG